MSQSASDPYEAGFLNFGSHSIKNKNEDRASMYISHKQDGLPFTASFSIFDGHNGKSAADICSQLFNRNVMRRIKAWSDIVPSRDYNLLPEEALDAIVCESLRASCEEMDSFVNTKYQSGSTLNSLVLSCDKSTGKTSAYCANIGDSRCVLYLRNSNARRTTAASSRRVSMSQRSGDDEDCRLDVSETPTQLSHYTPELNTTSRVLIFPMSDDHKVDYPRERQRIDENAAVVWHSLPCELSLHEISPPAGKHSMFHTNYPPSAALDEAAAFIKEIVTEVPSLAITKGVRYNDPVTYLHAIDQTGNAIEKPPAGEVQVQHEKSFVAPRTLPGKDVVGPEAIFGRFGPSINMTRSVGDKYGPRRCAAVPDVSAVRLEANEFARFVIASDGVWDVLSNEDVGKMVFAAMDPEEVAVRIAIAAQVKRLSEKKRRDDISVIVVEVNPGQNSLAETCCTFM